MGTSCQLLSQVQSPEETRPLSLVSELASGPVPIPPFLSGDFYPVLVIQGWVELLHTCLLEVEPGLPRPAESISACSSGSFRQRVDSSAGTALPAGRSWCSEVT